jgi:SPX domain protein involved in polyphosphate accumulation
MNVHIFNEAVPKEGKTWARDLDLPLRLSEIVTLKYAILEIKTQKAAPNWVEELKTSGYLIPAGTCIDFLCAIVI